MKSVEIGRLCGKQGEFSWCSSSWRMSGNDLKRRGLKLRRVLRSRSFGVEGVWRQSAGVVFKEWRSTLTATVVVNRDHMELLPVGNTALSQASTHPCATNQALSTLNFGTCPGQFLPRVFALGLLLLVYRWKKRGIFAAWDLLLWVLCLISSTARLTNHTTHNQSKPLQCLWK